MLLAEIEPLRAQGWRLVFTNGCFDLLHAGHVYYLEHARALGDALIVAVNSDEGVRRLKGPGRPLVPAAERARVVAALECVDYVTLFDEPDPSSVITLLRPHIHVKGGDYKADALPEAATVRSYGGQVVIVPMLPGHSTSALVQRLREPNESDYPDREAISPGSAGTPE